MPNANDRRSDEVFQDAIHGSMELPPLCVKIINTIQFQRLRNIKQLGLCYYVFPSASHNRFEHCLGTCHLAGKMVRHLKQQNPDLGISDRDILCVEISALCHDLGHAPFSHAFQEIINEYRNKNGGEEWEHEDASCQMLEHLLKENQHIKKKLKSEEIDFIKDLITGKSEKSQRPKFLYQIVNNKSYNIDVDKWDYLARDSHFLGIGTSFDHERMLKMSKVIDGTLCYRDKTLKNFYDMFYSRYRLHNTAYQHKTVLLLNKLLGDAFNSADKHLAIFEKVDEMKEFTYFTDSILEEILKCKGSKYLEDAQKKLKAIIGRSFAYKGTVTDTIEGTIKDTFEDSDPTTNTGKSEIDAEFWADCREQGTFREAIKDKKLKQIKCTIDGKIVKTTAGTKERKIFEGNTIEGTIEYNILRTSECKLKGDIEGTFKGTILDKSESNIEGNIKGNIEGKIKGSINEIINGTDRVSVMETDKICIARFDYGAKKRNPLLEIPFYKKDGSGPMYYTTEELENVLFLPKKFEMKTSHCFGMNL